MHRTCFLRLTRRANQGHIIIIADIVKLAPVNRPWAFSLAAMLSAGKFQTIEPVSSHFLQFVDGPKTI
ncbi:MAG: hypothetical protein ACREEK_30120 [Bradyrhizobium sp.]